MVHGFYGLGRFLNGSPVHGMFFFVFSEEGYSLFRVQDGGYSQRPVYGRPGEVLPAGLVWEEDCWASLKRQLTLPKPVGTPRPTC